MSHYEKLVDKHDVISFDIFDTLIKRNVEKPSDIFYLSALEVFKDEIKAEEFKTLRIEAESKARQELKDKEINIDDIYSFIDKNKFELESLKKAEIETEIKKCQPNQSIVSLFEYAKNKRKKIIIISDMYLPKTAIVRMLDRCHIDGYDKLYVSCECNCNKLTGKLFEYVLHENNLRTKQMIHFGDSVKADFIGAIKGHIKGCLTQRDRRIRKLLGKVIRV